MKKLLRLKAMLLLCALIAGSGSVWADEVTFDYADYKGKGTTSTGSEYTMEKSAVSITNTKFFGNNSQAHFYANGTTTVSPATGVTITKIVLTATSASYNGYQSNGTVTTSSGTLSYNGTAVTWEGKASEAFTITNNKQIRWTSIVVTYESASSDPTAPSAALSATSLDFGEVIFGERKELTFTVTPANLTSGLSISCDNSNYEVSPSKIAQATSTATTVTVTAKPTAIDDDMEGTITISGGGLSVSKTIALTTTVTKRDAVTPVGPAGTEGKYVKVTNTSDITDGQYLFVYEDDGVAFDGSLSTLDAGNNVISVTINNNEINGNDDLAKSEFTIDVTNGTVKSASGSYIGVSSNSNGLKTTTSATTYTHTFSIDEDGNAVIAASFSGSTMTLRFNSSSGDNNYRFRYYKSGQQAIQLYKYVPGSPADQFDVTISDAGYKTLVSTVDFKTQTGTTAYIVTASSASSATLTSVSEVPAGTPVILKGSGTVTLDVIDNAAAVNGNLLQVSTESTGNGVYVLADKDGVGFYKWTGGSLGAGRVYLPAPAAAAREFLSFDFEETTGINNVESSKLDVEGFYNLAGQRVAQPTKGLYIVNGKKVIIK